MGLFDNFPYTNFHELNLDWILKVLKDIETTIDQFVSLNIIKYADPIQWDIVRQYPKNTIVIDPISGTAYISVDNVPQGVALSNTDYWSVVFDLGRFITMASSNFADSYESVLTTTATMPTNVGHWVVWNSILYEALNDIHVGDRYVEDGNIKRRTVEYFYNKIINDFTEWFNQEVLDRTAADNALDGRIDQEILDRQAADNALGGRIDQEILDRQAADNALGGRIDQEILDRQAADNALRSEILGKIGDLDNLPTAIKTNIVASINELYNDISQIPTSLSYTTPEEHGAVGDGITDDTAAINNAFASENIVVFKPSTTYLISDTINIPSNGYLVGNGAVIKLESNTRITYVEGVDDQKGILTINDADNVTIENITIDVNGSTLPVYSNYTNVDNVALSIENSSNITVRGCKFINLYTEGIDTHITHGHINIVNNYFKHVTQNQGLRKDCIYCVTHNNGSMIVQGNICDETGINNIYGCGGIFFASVNNCNCNNNIVLNCGRRNQFGHPVAAICVYSECMNINVENNYIKAIEGIFRSDASAKISFRYNYCTFDGSYGYSDSDYLRFTYYDPSNLAYWGEYTIEGNTIIIDNTNIGGARGIGVGHNNSRPLHSIRIFNNDIQMYNDAVAIYAKCNDIYIQHNRFYRSDGNAHPDIRISDGGDNIVITDNTARTIRLERDAGSSQVCYHVCIANNTCSGSGACIKMDYTSYADVHDNIFEGRFEAGSGIYSVIVHDNVAHDSNSGYGYYGSVTAQHDNYYNNALVAAFQ